MSHDAQHFSSTFAANAGNDIPKPREEVDPNTLSVVNFGYENTADLSLEFETQAFSRMIQKLGGEIYAFRAWLSAQHDNLQTVSRVDLQSYQRHFECISQEYFECCRLFPHSETFATSLHEMKGLTQKWYEGMQRVGHVEQRRITSVYFEQLLEHYEQLQHCIVGPNASKHQIRLLEFDSAVTGPPIEILQDIELLERDLLIDLSVMARQLGFGSLDTVQELTRIMSLEQSHIFAIYQGDRIRAFALPVFGVNSTQELYPDALELLIKHGHVSPDENIGSLRTIGSVPQPAQLYRNDLHLHGQLDKNLSALAEAHGVHKLIGVIREGPQGNRSHKALQRRGYLMTGLTYVHKGTLYQAVYKPLQPNINQIGCHGFDYSQWHFDKCFTSIELAGNLAKDAPLMMPSEAIALARKLLQDLGFGPDRISVKTFEGSSFSLSLENDSRSVHCPLNQLKARRDFWQDFQNRVGRLEEVLPGALEAFGYYSTRRNRD